MTNQPTQDPVIEKGIPITEATKGKNIRLLKRLEEILTDFYRHTLRVDGNTPNARTTALQAICLLNEEAMGSFWAEDSSDCKIQLKQIIGVNNE